MAALTDDAASVAMKPMPYFGHDSNAHDDIKCKLLMLRGGVEAYGRWWLLCELLASVNGHRIDYTTDDYRQVVALSLQCTVEQADTFLGWCAELGLINAELFGCGVIVSDRMSHNAQCVAKKIVSGRRGGRKKTVNTVDSSCG